MKNCFPPWSCHSPESQTFSKERFGRTLVMVKVNTVQQSADLQELQTRDQNDN